MHRRLVTHEDLGAYRFLIGLSQPFDRGTLPAGYDYEVELDALLDRIWTRRMADVLGIPRNGFPGRAHIDRIQHQRDLLDIALIHGPFPTSTGCLAAFDQLRLAEQTGHLPAGVHVPALRVQPVRVAAWSCLEVWCGAAAALPADLALITADSDLLPNRLTAQTEPSHRAHCLAGARLKADCSRVKDFYGGISFAPGSVVATRGYFSRGRYIAHAVPPDTDNGVWKHTVEQLSCCYTGFYVLAGKLAADDLAIQLIPLGREPRLRTLARSILLDEVERHLDTRGSAAPLRLVAATAKESFQLARDVIYRRLDRRFRDGGLRPAGSPSGIFSPGALAANKSTVLTDNAADSRSRTSRVGFSRSHSSRLT